MRLYMLMCLLVLLMASSPHAHFSASGEASGEDDPTEQTPTTASPTSLPERLLVNCPFPLPWPFPPLNYLKMPMAVFYPCLPTPQHIDDIPECDVFAYLALQQTREAINIPNSTHFDVQYKPRLLTCFIITPIDIQTREDPMLAIDGFIGHPQNRDTELFGILGPATTNEVDMLSPLISKLYKRPMISFANGDQLDEEENEYFYTTIPTDHFLNRARVGLMCRNNWRRIAVLSSADATQSNNAADFSKLASKSGQEICNFSTTVKSVQFGAYASTPDTILRRLQEDDMRIIFAFVEQKKARELICKASLWNLTTPDHVWVLPGYYNHRWWQENITYDYSGCSDDQVKDAANSIIFVDFNNLMLFNTTGERLKSLLNRYRKTISTAFTPAFLNKSISQGAYRFLYHSKAMRASDAMLIMAKAWDSALYELVTEYPSDVILQTMRSERDKPDPDRPENFVVKRVRQKLEECVFAGAAGVYSFSKKSKNKHLGEAMITRFSGESECLYGVLANHYLRAIAPESNYQFSCLNVGPTDIDVNETFSFLNGTVIREHIARYDNETDDDIIKLSDIIMESCQNWSFPPDGDCYEEKCYCFRNVSPGEVLAVAVVSVMVIAVALLLLGINIILRNNKYIKASSPRLNILIIVGCILMCPCAFLVGVEHSGLSIFTRDILMLLLPPVCELRRWLFFIGLTLVVATMLTRNWRLYRIFFNKSLRTEMHFNSDRALVCIIALLLVPLLIVLVISSAVDSYKFMECSKLDPCPELGHPPIIRTFRNQSSCDAFYNEAWDALMMGYNILLCCLLIFFAYQNSQIKAHFQQEGEFATKTVMLVFTFVFLGTVILVLLNYRNNRIQEYFWAHTCFVLGVTVAILGALFLPKFIIVCIEWKEKMKLTRKQAVNEVFVQRYKMKQQEIDKLRGQLRVRENSIASIKHRMSTDVGRSRLYSGQFTTRSTSIGQFSTRSNSLGPLLYPLDLSRTNGELSPDMFIPTDDRNDKFILDSPM